MNKKMLSLLAGVAMISSVSTGSAAESVFSDVPAGHWAYDAVKQLSADGIIEGYKDGTFRGQNTITRYEMAVITANAMTKLQGASPEDQKLVGNMGKEFANELQQINIRVDNLEARTDKIEKTQPKIMFSGSDRVRFENAENSQDSQSKTYNRFRLNMVSPLDKNITFVGRIEAENRAGTTSDINLTQAFITGHDNFGEKMFLLGRIPLHLGQGMLSGIGAEGSWSSGADGGVICFGNELMVTAAAGKAGGADELSGNAAGSLNLIAGNLEYVGIPNLDLTASYLADKDKTMIDSFALGFNYSGIKDWKLTSEYGVNRATMANLFNGDDASAYTIQAKYAGADPKKKGSHGAWVRYRDADPGFDLLSLGECDAPEVMKTFNGSNQAYNMSNVKGFDFGYERTVFNNGVLTLNYGTLKKKEGSGDDNAAYGMASMEYFF